VRGHGVKFVDPPVIGLTRFKCARRKSRGSLCGSAGGVGDIVEVVAEIDGVQLGAETRCPAQFDIRIDKLGPFDRYGLIGLLGRNQEAPDTAFPGAVRIGLINRIDPPIIRCPRDKTLRIGEAREASNQKRIGLVAAECVARAFIYVVEIASSD
jgi:hypothetical protein